MKTRTSYRHLNVGDIIEHRGIRRCVSNVRLANDWYGGNDTYYVIEFFDTNSTAFVKGTWWIDAERLS